MIAARFNNLALVQLILGRGADVNTQNYVRCEAVPSCFVLDVRVLAEP